MNPVELAIEILEERETIASEWGAALATSGVSDVLQELLREDLEAQLGADAP